jgi:hypothetical protein
MPNTTRNKNNGKQTKKRKYTIPPQKVGEGIRMDTLHTYTLKAGAPILSTILAGHEKGIYFTREQLGILLNKNKNIINRRLLRLKELVENSKDLVFSQHKKTIPQILKEMTNAKRNIKIVNTKILGNKLLFILMLCHKFKIYHNRKKLSEIIGEDSQIITKRLGNIKSWAQAEVDYNGTQKESAIKLLEMLEAIRTGGKTLPPHFYEETGGD